MHSNLRTEQILCQHLGHFPVGKATHMALVRRLQRHRHWISHSTYSDNDTIEKTLLVERSKCHRFSLLSTGKHQNVCTRVVIKYACRVVI